MFNIVLSIRFEEKNCRYGELKLVRSRFNMENPTLNMEN